MFLEMNIRIQPSFPPFKDEFDDTMKKDLKELDKIFGKFVKSKTKVRSCIRLRNIMKSIRNQKRFFCIFLKISIYRYMNI